MSPCGPSREGRNTKSEPENRGYNGAVIPVYFQLKPIFGEDDRAYSAEQQGHHVFLLSKWTAVARFSR